MNDSEKLLSVREMAGILAGMKDSDEIFRFFEEIMTPSELSNLELRWALLKKLASGQTQREIASELGISLCKITRGAKFLKDEKSVIYNILKK